MPVPVLTMLATDPALRFESTPLKVFAAVEAPWRTMPRDVCPAAIVMFPVRVNASLSDWMVVAPPPPVSVMVPLIVLSPLTLLMAGMPTPISLNVPSLLVMKPTLAGRLMPPCNWMPALRAAWVTTPPPSAALFRTLRMPPVTTVPPV